MDHAAGGSVGFTARSAHFRQTAWPHRPVREKTLVPQADQGDIDASRHAIRGMSRKFNLRVSPLANCDICGGFTLGNSNICAMCANTANGRRIGPGREFQYRPVMPAAPPIFVAPTYQIRATIENNAGGLAGHLAAWVPLMVNWLGVRGYWGANAATGFGAQATPNGCTVGTRSLDFQGIRAGQNGVFWIDIQAQLGGGGAPRNTHAQVLIQCTGHPVAAPAILAALNGSLGLGRRALLHVAGGAANAP